MKAMEMKSAGKRAPEEKATPLKTTTIRQKEFIPAKPVEIYDAFLNEQRHTAFTGARATCDRRVGGKFTAWDGYISGRNLKTTTIRQKEFIPAKPVEIYDAFLNEQRHTAFTGAR